MKPLDSATKPATTPDHPAELVMETVSQVMRAIRREMREQRPVEMSIQQFRALRIVDRHPGESLSIVASRLGVTDASASKLVDALVRSELVKRIDAPEDRRKIVLSLTAAGRSALERAREAALGRLGGILAALGESDRQAVIRAMNILHEALGDEPPSRQGSEAAR